MFKEAFEKLLEYIEHFSCFTIIDAYEGGVILRLGKWHRTLAAGLHWKWPFIERVLTERTCIDTIHCGPQNLTTKDLQQIGVSSIVRFRIVDVRAFLLDIQDQHTSLIDITLGLTRKAVETRTFEELVTTPWEREVRSALRATVSKYGIEVIEVTYADLGKIKAIRLLMTDQEKHAEHNNKDHTSF